MDGNENHDEIENDDENLDLDQEDGGQDLDEPAPEKGEEEDEDKSGESEDDKEEEDKSGDAQAEKRTPKRSFQKRINKVTREKHDALRQAEEERKKRVAVEQQLAELNATSGRPKQSDFDDYEQYEAALEKWARETTPPAAEPDTSEELSLEEIELGDAVDNIVTQAEQPDFVDVVFNPALDLNIHMVRAASESELAADLLYYLGQNPDEAAQIANMPPSSVPRAIGRLEAKLEGGSATARPKGKTPPKAPPPVIPVKTGGEPEDTTLSPKLSTDEWIKRRREQRAKNQG